MRADSVTTLRRHDDGWVTVHYDPRLTDQLVEHPEWAAEMARRGPRCRVETIAGCGHAPDLNTAAQIGVVAAFLAT